MAGFEPTIKSFADFCLTNLATCSFAEAKGIEQVNVFKVPVISGLGHSFNVRIVQAKSRAGRYGELSIR